MSFCTWSTTENIMRYVRDVCNDTQGQTAQRIKRFQTILPKKKIQLVAETVLFCCAMTKVD